MSKKSFPRKVGEWTELNQQEVYDNAWIKVTHSEVLNPNGGQGIYGVVHFKNLALGVIPLDDDLNTWLVGQERFPFDGKYTWEIIEGGGPIDQNPVESAQRELAEEASLQAQKWELIQEMDLSNSATNEKALIYLATNLSFATAKADATEKLKLKKLPFSSVFEMVLKGEIIDSLSVVGILKAHHLLQKRGLL
jgi:8-oxo-dGTP pyrophosphatase MutT (NUDIX family)